MVGAISCLILISLIGLPIFLATRGWASRQNALLTGSVTSALVIAYDIAQNGIDYGPLQIGPFVYVIRFVTGAAFVALLVVIVSAVFRRLSKKTAD